MKRSVLNRKSPIILAVGVTAGWYAARLGLNAAEGNLQACVLDFMIGFVLFFSVYFWWLSSEMDSDPEQTLRSIVARFMAIMAPSFFLGVAAFAAMFWFLATHL